MRKFILFFILACLHVATRGQTIEGVDLSVLPKPTQAAKLQYWFDDDIASLSSQLQVGGTHSIDVSSLLTGVHTIHYQIIDNNGKVGVPYSALFIKLAQYQLEASGLQYWFNDDDKSPKKTSLQNGISTIDVSSIGVGLHTLHYQILDSHNSPLYIASAMFMNMGENLGDGTLRAERLLYWYDDEEKLNNAEISSGIKTLDASHLPEGLHTLHYQVLCNNGSLTVASSAFFYRVNSDTSTAKAKQLRYWYDDQTSVLTASITSGTQMLDVSGLLAGIHVLHYQIVDDSGALGVPSSTMFMKMDVMEELAAAKSQRYWFDDDESNMRECAVANGVQELDVQNLEVGFHTLHYQLVDAAGNVTVPYSNVFMKTPEYTLIDGKNAITRYQYWINDDATITSVDVAKPTSPYQLISLLPMPKAPIRSSSFHFEPKNGEPMIYAKNDVHFRFFNAAGYWGDEARSFVDYSVSQKVTVTKSLTEAIGTETIASPSNNSIKWYSMECEKGDSLSFKLSHPASIQLFSPSGDELLNTSGSESITMSGARVTENGTCYIAIHDATSSSSNISLNYMRIGKFALLSTSNPIFGVLPAYQILELEGNGFDNLKNVTIANNGVTITADSIAHITNQTVKAYWLFDGNETLGEYDLTLRFDDGEEQRNIIKDKYVVLEKPSFDDIAINISDPRRVADPYPVYIKVTNNSNITYQAIPFYFAIDHMERMQSVEYMDFSVGCCKELSDAGLQLSFDYDSFKDNGIKTRVVPTIIPELLPGETATFTLGVRTGAHQEFHVYAWTGRPWSLLAPETVEYVSKHYSEINSARKQRRAPGAAGIFDGCEDDPCDLAQLGPSASECVCATALALGGTIGGVNGALMNSHLRGQREMLEQNGLVPDPYFNDRYLPSPEDLIWYWVQHCLPGKAGTAASTYNTGRQIMGNNPCQDPPPHPVNPYNPGDPNEIHGYLSEAGSNYIRQDVLDVSYTIEFENDPKLANASAHKIVVCDTLDNNVFDMATYHPTSVKIGNKSIELDGEPNSVQTLDMRPDINTIAEIRTEFNQKTGIAKWTITSLDPMSMEETYDIMQGVLPVNNGGNGVGFVSYDISLKRPLNDGNSFSNQASIVFDFEDPILTPVWTNTIDAIAPTSKVTNVEMKEDSKFSIHFDGEDARSGIWKYDVYYRWTDDMDWIRIANGCDSTAFDKEAVAGYAYQFCVVATDSAGNVEQKSLTPEFEFSTGDKLGDVNQDGKVDVTDIAIIVSIINGNTVSGYKADIDNDGDVDIDDLNKLIELILKK